MLKVVAVGQQSDVAWAQGRRQIRGQRSLVWTQGVLGAHLLCPSG